MPSTRVNTTGTCGDSPLQLTLLVSLGVTSSVINFTDADVSE